MGKTSDADLQGIEAIQTLALDAFRDAEGERKQIWLVNESSADLLIETELYENSISGAMAWLKRSDCELRLLCERLEDNAGIERALTDWCALYAHQYPRFSTYIALCALMRQACLSVIRSRLQ